MTMPDDNELEEFATTYRREIVFNLRSLIHHGEYVSVIFDEGRETFLTVLLAVDEENGILVFDCGSAEETGQRFLESERNFFVCAPQGVHNQFLTGKAWETTHRGQRAFAVGLPARYSRMQRRKAFRLLLPMTLRPQCTLAPKADGQQPVFSVVDISIAGIGLETPMAASAFAPGQVLAGAAIDLKSLGMLRVDLEIKFASQAQRGGKQVGRLGCQFVNISPAQEKQLQEFITQVQREERARLTGV